MGLLKFPVRLVKFPVSSRAHVEFYRALISRCVIFTGALILVSGLVGSASGGGADSNSDALVGLIMGAAVCIIGLAGSWWYVLPAAITRREAFVAAGLTLLVIVGISAVFYLLTGAISQFDSALVESVAGFCTTGFSTVANPEELSRTVLFWRASTQWLGGIGALSFSLLLIPLFHSAGRENTLLGRVPLNASRFRETSGSQSSSQHGNADFESFVKLYFLLTAGLAIAYFAAGLGGFDAVTYAATTVSTGGFMNYPWFFSSQAVQWVAIVGMFLAGINGALLFKALRGSPGSLWRSVEFRVYCGLAALATAVSVGLEDIEAVGERIRFAFFSVTSAMSTTGFRMVDWGEWPVGEQMLLLLLIATGAMVGSASGGFQILRATEAAHYLAREVKSHAVGQLSKTRHDFLGEEPLARMQAFQFVYLAAVGAGALGLACFGSDLVTSISASVSSLATMGPALGELSPASDLFTVSRPERLVVALLMFVGRLFVYPVLIIVGTLVAKARWIRR